MGNNGVVTDNQGRTGYIASNRHFHFGLLALLQRQSGPRWQHHFLPVSLRWLLQPVRRERCVVLRASHSQRCGPSLLLESIRRTLVGKKGSGRTFSRWWSHSFKAKFRNRSMIVA